MDEAYLRQEYNTLLQEVNLEVAMALQTFLF